ncbi:mce related protein [Poriferisphaera corsica]|uniref:Mce related protein n=1 Tax=Poriferisphaera corsica TaxID=2528020 RepID=A0A517YW70_9BACT|nr:MlaD family protein [Poriferisphaera corsica]QDU34473.1 mce related protein [Poriferisphaera corsica]
MKDRFRNIAVGFTALGGVLGLMVLLLLFGWLPEILQPGYLLTIKASSASGISVDSNVYLEGIAIGKVRKITLQPPPGTGVDILCKIDDKYHLPEGIEVSIPKSLLSGSGSISFSRAKLEDYTDNTPMLALDGSAVIIATESSPFAQLTGQLNTMLKEPLDKFTNVADHITELSDTWNQLGQNLSKLSQFESLTDVDDGKAVGNLATVLQRADSRLKQFKTVLSGIDSYVNDKEIHENFTQTVANARDLTANANQTVTDVKADIAQLKNRYILLADDLSKTVNTLQDTLEEAKEGKGTVGQLLANPALYNNMNDASERLRAAMRELQILFEKWNTEGIELNL